MLGLASETLSHHMMNRVRQLTLVWTPQKMKQSNKCGGHCMRSARCMAHPRGISQCGPPRIHASSPQVERYVVREHVLVRALRAVALRGLPRRALGFTTVCPVRVTPSGQRYIRFQHQQLLWTGKTFEAEHIAVGGTVDALMKCGIGLASQAAAAREERLGVLSQRCAGPAHWRSLSCKCLDPHGGFLEVQPARALLSLWEVVFLQKYRIVSHRIVSCRVVSCRVVSCRVVPCRAVPCRAVPCRAVPCRVVSCRVVSCRVVSCRVVWCRVVSCRVVSCRVVSCRVVSCRVVSCRVVSCRVVSCRVVSCRVVSCRVVSCRRIASAHFLGTNRPPHPNFGQRPIPCPLLGRRLTPRFASSVVSCRVLSYRVVSYPCRVVSDRIRERVCPPPPPKHFDCGFGSGFDGAWCRGHTAFLCCRRSAGPQAVGTLVNVPCRAAPVPSSRPSSLLGSPRFFVCDRDRP